MKDIRVNPNEYVPDHKKVDQGNKDLKKACQEFESIFTYQLLKSMRRTIEKSDLFHGGQGEEIYESLLDQELAKNVSASDYNSLANLIYQQFKREDPSGIGQGEDIGAGEDLVGNPPLGPLKAPISSEFGWRKDPINGQNRFHYGLDLAAEEGTLVRASLPGRVIMSEYQEGYGNLVVLDHGHGLNTLYAHNRDNLSKQGDWVRRGTPLARVGSSGRTTGPHLHFEVKRHGRRLDPRDFLGSELDGP